MRLLMTTDTVGGVWTYTTELAGELLRRGASIALVTIGGAPAPDQTRWLEWNRAHWKGSFHWQMTEAPLEWMSNNERAFLDVVPQLVRVAEDFGAELLHSNQFCFGALPVPIPRLVVAHSDVLSWARACREEAAEPELERGPWLNSYYALTAAGLNKATAVVAPTRWMLSALGKTFCLPRETHIIANGRTLGVPALRPTNKLQAVTAGRLWDEAKNIMLLGSVNAPFPMLVAGETEYHFHKLPVMPSGIKMLGSLREDELLALFRESAVYICTSRYEPFGLAPLEAALCGCAVLANDIPSLREVWGDGALYFRGASSLSIRLIQLSRHPQELVEAQRRSWNRAQRYSASVMADQYLALYRTMLRKWEPSSDVA
jgi:glycogen(starch) synthase